jgi:hypothetical protein
MQWHSAKHEGSEVRNIPEKMMQEDNNRLFRTRIISDFWPQAQSARTRFEEFLGNPYSHDFYGSHQCWDFWYVPNQYCYLKTDPAKVVGRDLVDDFLECLNKFCQAEFPGLEPLDPCMSLHINGMRHEVHNDSRNGTCAYILSLTRDINSFTGGETCVARRKIFDDLEPRRNIALDGYFEVIRPVFNQLVLFDDRVAHMVPVVQGTMNPLSGRVCLTGHLR